VWFRLQEIDEISSNSCKKMLRKSTPTHQLNFLMATLSDQLDHTNGLYRLAQTINWTYFDNEFSKHYSSDFGRPALPIRLMVSLLILKNIRNLSDESVVEQWSENCYFQFFSGATIFTPRKPCDATELVNFRKRIGEDGIEKIFTESIRVNGKDGQEKEIIADTTVQEKNITFPTDSKLHCKIIDKCLNLAEQQQLDLRQSYRRTVPKLRYEQRGRNHPKHFKKARKADRKIKTIAGRLVRELERKLPPEHYFSEELSLFKLVLNQKRSDTNKIYSLHEPHVQCISKGKDHKKYEFGNKVSLLKTKTTGVIVGALSFEKNIYDGNTLPQSLEQYERITGIKAKKVFCDLGYRGKKKIGTTEVITPDAGKGLLKGSYKKRKHKRDMKTRSGIEPVIGHIKQDHRLGRNFLKGIAGDKINLLMAAAAFNFKRFIRLKLHAFFRLVYSELCGLLEIISANAKPAFNI
jgi:IS5 family transposase